MQRITLREVNPIPQEKISGMIDEFFDLRIHLLKRGLLSIDQIKIAEIEHQKQGKRLEEILVNLGFLSDQVLREIIADLKGISIFNLQEFIIDAHLLINFSKNVAERYQVLPLFCEEKTLHAALVDVDDLIAIDQLRYFFPHVTNIIPYVATSMDLSQAIDKAYGHALSIEGLLYEIEEKENKDKKHTEGTAIRFINTLLMDAVKRRASDIHFEPEGTFIRCRYRLDGVLRQICTFHRQYWPMLLVRLKIMSEMDITENRFPQHGRFSFIVANREVDFRAASHPTVHGENFVVRILDKRHSLLPLEELGFKEATVHSIKQLIKSPQGLVVVTGPTGSGKTTTLYSMLRYIASTDVNIMTLEEPVEYELPLIRQTEVREPGGVSFVEGIRSILRQDPDIIFIGEVRDEETAKMALRAAMTGHLVLTTLHTNNAFDIISRFKDLGISPQMLAGHLRGVIAQRLLRKLCSFCKIERNLTQEEKLLFQEYKQSAHIFWEAEGCDECEFTGYKGRIAVAEWLVFDEQMDDLLSDAKLTELRTYVQSQGFQSMSHAALSIFQEGIVNMAEIERVVGLRKI
ncbi:MAG: Flp pilus assembly complex ATPase component TadA [Candidatus Paracaedimonas acanthamoebae]|uniref:Flp pilus assembly complex ATPase component TadA n=1 Tax=Candidatus Paracaedimonas acanthamoebae TaxID=244581 RepID=A0A8J7TSG7_9PROT|nr:Flp pilus assembly complex ATPase component TadA [Candidatus Paracaedimonas acanthamoebae]